MATINIADHVSSLESQGYSRERATIIASQGAARAFAALVNPSAPAELEYVASDLAGGKLTLRQYVDSIMASEKVDRDTAWARAERNLRTLRNATASAQTTGAPRMNAVPLNASILNGDDGRPLTIVQLADKIQKEDRCNRDTAFDRAAQLLRG